MKTEQPNQLEAICHCGASRYVEGWWRTRSVGKGFNHCVFCGDRLSGNRFAYRMVRADHTAEVKKELAVRNTMIRGFIEAHYPQDEWRTVGDRLYDEARAATKPHSWNDDWITADEQAADPPDDPKGDEDER